MHFIVIVRYVFFAIAILSLIGLFVTSIVGMHNSVTLSHSALILSLVLSIYFILLLILDHIRTKTGFAYRLFIFKIWWELISISIFTIVTIVLLAAEIVKPQGAACFQHRETTVQPSQHVCSINNSIWTFEIILAITSFCYVFFLVAVTIDQYERTPSVVNSGVRDFNWKANLAPQNPYRVDYDPYTGSSYTAESLNRSLDKYKTRLANSRAQQPLDRSPYYAGSLNNNASRSTFDAPSASSIATPSSTNASAGHLPSTVNFTSPRRMEEAHVRLIPGGSRFIEHLDD